MVFRLLKVLGFDVSAKIDAVVAGLELRAEEISDHLKQAAQEAAVIGALSASAAITGAMALGVGLIALYRGTAEAAGAYVGLEVDGAVLVVVTVLLALAAIIKSKSLSRSKIKKLRYAGEAQHTSPEHRIITHESVVDAGANATHPLAAPTAATPAVGATSDINAVEPLAFFLSKVIQEPSGDNPFVDEIMGNLRATAKGTPGEAIDRAANVIRRGDRKELALILTGAAFIGWLLTR
jgi:hypothetical protein